MAKSKEVELEPQLEQLQKDYSNAWESLTPMRQAWEDRELALLARNSDSFSGSVVRAKVTDATLSTLAWERQARVAAQLPTGKVYPAGKGDEGKAKLADIILHQYIIPNAGRGFDMLTLQRMWGVYASVYGSMPMFYDYCVEDDYIGPYATLLDPRCFLPQPGRNSIKESDWAMVSTIVNLSYLERIAEKKTSSWDQKAIKKLIKEAKKSNPTRTKDAEKESQTSQTRYSKELAEDQVELVTQYENGDKGRWITFAPDFIQCGILRDIPNPHKSGRIPVVMRHCFPLMNSIYGLGDFERGIKIQKAKDSFLGLRLEFAKNLVFPPMKVNLQNVTPSTIKWGANQKWLVSDMNNSVDVQQFTPNAMNEFQSTFTVLNTILQNQFGTSDTTVSGEQSANQSFGKTPQALKMLEQRENARDTWDRFMHETAVEELYECLINLLSHKIEKPINFTIFEENIRQIQDEYGPEVLEVIAGGKIGNITIPRKNIHTDKGLTYMVDANSSMQKDDSEQFQALAETMQIVNKSPQLLAILQQQGIKYDIAEHFKQLFISAGISNWERILQEADPEEQAAMQQQQQEQTMMEQIANQQAQTQAQAQQAVSQFQDPDVQAFAQQMFGGQG